MVWKIADEVMDTTGEQVGLHINGVPLKAPPAQSLLVTCRQHGFELPTLCHHPDLPSEGQCRLCLVEIGEYPATRLVNACTYPTEANLWVQTASERVVKARKMVLELLLARAPKAQVVRDLAASMGIYESRFKVEDPEEMCILCGLCVRACREIVGVSAISMAYRTPDKLVTTPFKEAADACIGCGSCAFICPTGVIPYWEKDGVRTIWGRDFELQPCNVCGNYIAPKAQLEHWARITGDPVETFFVCKDCR